MNNKSINRRGETIQIYNCRVLRDGHIYEDDYLWMRDGRLLDPQHCFWSERLEPDERINAHGLLATPGLIDVQINGAFGVDFSADFDAMQAGGVTRAAQGLLRQGCTAFCPTLVSSAPEIYRQVSTHLEGPFIAQEKKGAHDAQVLQSSVTGVADLEKMYGPIKADGTGCIVTVAPELPGMLDCIKELSQRGVVVSLGHTTARIATAEQAIRCGFHHRDPAIMGLLGSVDLPRPYYGLIADGFHAHPCAVRIAYSAHPKGVVLVTDAMAALGLPLGTYSLGDMRVEMTEDAVYVAGTQTLAGSAIPLAECIRRFRKFTNCSIVEAIDAATLHPAKLLGIETKKGTLHHGADADLCFFDDQLRVQQVFIHGEPVDHVDT
ncbi:putative N-acetylglucosamine-6-phosphate deacetylase [Syncephalis plumigaleata]|nr:putative N-acetylglucosamine-6-phosphate deacetylase [Syncephalis plumigaleata]